MAYTALQGRAGSAAGFDSADLAGAAGRFLRERCEGLRFDAAKTAREAAEGVFLGRSLRDGQIPYNMQMDVDRLCLERAAGRFLASGAAEDAFDVYFCYLEMFAGDYRGNRSMVELLSEFENNGSALLMKHRDHYSHSVYVFLLGLAIFESSRRFRAVYESFYGLAPDAAARHFLEYWGLTALFHDVGYPFELPFEQVCSYFEVSGLKREGMPYLAYQALEDYTRLPEALSPALAALYGPDAPAQLNSLEDLFARHLAGRLGEVYGFTQASLREILGRKPTHPESFSHFMDHAWFSAALLLRTLYCGLGRPLAAVDMDAMSAILLHNSLYKFSVAHYKDPTKNKPFRMELHPLAYLLMLCDELQCWDRTAYGRNSRGELHPMDCRFRFTDGALAATYIFDAQQRPKLDEYERRLAAWQAAKPAGDDPAAGKQWEKSKPRLKACSDMLPGPDGGRSDFLRDIDSIVDTSPLGLTADIAWEPRQQSKKHSYLSDSSFLHLYCFAVCLNGRWMLGDAWAAARAEGRERDFLLGHTAEFEAAFGALSLEYKLSNINQAKAFDDYLNAIGCFYTDRPVDYPFLERFTPADTARIGPMEHERWLREHFEMGWAWGLPADGDDRERRRIHPDMIPAEALDRGALTPEAAARHYATLAKAEQAKDVEAMNAMLTLLQIYDGVRIYRYREEETKP